MFFTKTLNTYFYLPFYESIKNYGFRLAVPAYLGFTLLLANYTEKIWNVLSNWLKTKIWVIIKAVSVFIFKVTIAVLGVVWLTLLLLQNQILEQLKNAISLAYNDKGFIFLRNRMEGMEQNNLDFYFLKAENLYSTIQHWTLVTFIVLFMIFTFAIILRFYNNKSVKIAEKYPFLKFEMLLAIPLFFSISMWTKLATSVPYTDFPVQTVENPTVIGVGDSSCCAPKMLVTPKEMILEPGTEKRPSGYKFPQIVASDYKYLSIKTKNAVLLDAHNRLMIKPLDNEEIILTFETKTVNKTLLITIISWIAVIIFFVVSGLRSKKLRVE